ncbi:MAG: hypothetical protein KA144_12070 [Xanthomonadaceae bacterium]|nr:hypothetical protein [Xanthomonadaceae bacterium]
MTTCKECKAQISTTAESCPQCGAKPKKTSGCAIIVAAFLGLSVLSAIVRGCSGDTTPTMATSTATGTQPATAEPPKADPAAVLAESQTTVAEIESRLKQNSDHLKKYYGTPEQVKQATGDLIKLAVVQGLYEKSGNREEKKLGTKAGNLIPSVSQQQRTIYASASEEIFVKSGMDVNVSATGKKKEQLRLKYVLMSQPLVYKFQNELKLPEQARALGFKKIIYSDGYNESWNVDL